MDGPQRLEQRKQAVRERDRRMCMNCYRSGDDSDVTLDVHHIVPRGSAGSDRLSNMVLLCRQCHDAVHEGDEMAPRVKSHSKNSMDEDEFQVYKALFDAIGWKYDADEKCWFLPLGDAKQLLGVDDISELSESDSSELELPIEEFM